MFATIQAHTFTHFAFCNHFPLFFFFIQIHLYSPSAPARTLSPLPLYFSGFTLFVFSPSASEIKLLLKALSSSSIVLEAFYEKINKKYFVLHYNEKIKLRNLKSIFFNQLKILFYTKSVKIYKFSNRKRATPKPKSSAVNCQ